MTRAVRLAVNGVEHVVAGGADQQLLAILREQLGLTAAKPGCGEGVCGSCTVLVDREPVRSCIVTAADVAERQVTTLEGLAPAGTLHPLQQAFLEQAAFQCGYCTPGMIVSAAVLLAADPGSRRLGDRRRAGGKRLPLLCLSADRRGRSPGR